MTETGSTTYPENGQNIDDVDRILHDQTVFDVVSEEDKAYQKLRGLCTAILDPEVRVEFRLDFDKTLTTWDSPNTWQAAYLELSDTPLAGDSPSLREESYLDRTECMRLQKAGRLDGDAMDAWTLRELQRHVRNNTTEAALEKRTIEGIEFRKGVDRFFDLTSSLDIEPLIASAGLGNVVQTALKACGIEIPRENIISNWFNIDGADNEMIVNSRNKRAHIDRLRPITDDRVRYAAVFGDSVDDSRMTDGGISIRPHGPKPNDEAYIDESRKACFDVVLRHDTLYGLITFLTKLLDVAQERRKAPMFR